MIEDVHGQALLTLLPVLTESSSDLIQAGILSSVAERIVTDRGASGRSAYDEEIALERRVEASRMSISPAIAVARETAATQPFLINSGVAIMLNDPLLAAGFRDQFDALLGVSDGDYAKVMLALCDQIDLQLRPRNSSSDEIRPVSGGEVTGCDLILLGSMLGGATCVVGCGPCCVVGVGGALIYVGTCT